MKIWTLSVNGFRGSKGLPNLVNDKEIEANLKKFEKLIECINLGVDDVVVLQEIPHKLITNNSGSGKKMMFIINFASYSINRDIKSSCLNI